MSFKSTPPRITAQTHGSRRFQGVRPAFIRTLVLAIIGLATAIIGLLVAYHNMPSESDSQRGHVEEYATEPAPPPPRATAGHSSRDRDFPSLIDEQPPPIKENIARSKFKHP